jgi:hypothetical protein
MRIFRQIKDKQILLISFDNSKQIFASSSTRESDLQSALWQMYSTARAESLAALIAGMGFLTQTNIGNAKIDHDYIQLIGWFFICFVALIESSEYMTQTGRMLRAGYFSRQIERRLIKIIGNFSDDMAWEIFLSRKKRRLFPGYYITGGGTILLLAGAQFSPFLLYPPDQRLNIFSQYSQHWSELPTVGTIGIVLLCLVQFYIYQNRFPIED